MMVLLLAAMAVGGFAFTFTLWATGVGGGPGDAALRLARMRQPQSSQGVATPAITLRRRGGVRLAGISFVSSDVSAEWTTQLERAGLTLNAKEYLVLRIVVALVLGAVTMMALPIPLLAIGPAVLGFMVVGMWVKMRIKSRRQKLEHQMVEMLQMLASGLRAGFGLLQALESSADQLPDPLSIEIRRTLRDTAMGASVEQALTALNQRVGSPDFDIVITAILIQRSVGGNLAEILDNVAHTMRERERIRGEIRTLTSQQRLTGFVIGGIPIGLFLIFMIISPEFTGLLFTHPLGRVMLGGAVVLEGIGFFIINKIVNIEI
jgi:tight adherence protein B